MTTADRKETAVVLHRLGAMVTNGVGLTDEELRDLNGWLRRVQERLERLAGGPEVTDDA